jgi:magnesium transporter
MPPQTRLSRPSMKSCIMPYSQVMLDQSGVLKLTIGFLSYCLLVIIFASIMIYKVCPEYGRKNPLVYISICSTVGSISVMSIKGFGIALKLTFAGQNQFTHPSTYVFFIVVVVCILIQMNYFNKALDQFSTSMYVALSDLI